MRQRNDTPYALYAPADPPFEVLPGETVDYHTYLVGLTPVPDEPPVLVGESGPELVVPVKKSAPKKALSGEEPTE